MQLLARRLSRRGFQTYCLSYASLLNTPEQNRSVVAHQLSRIVASKLYVVAHSYGGVLALQLFRNDSQRLRIERLLLLGTPVRGSELARVAAASRWKKYLLGKAIVALTNSVDESLLHRITGEIPVGVLAGVRNQPFLARIVGRLAQGDGVIATDETDVPGACKLNLPVAHLQMLWSGPSFEAVAHFLHHGDFPARDEVS